MSNLELFPLSDIPTAEVRRQPRSIRDSVDEARTFGGWTLNKLEVFRIYLTQFRRVAGSASYLDLFAGDGRARIDGDELPGSARIALDSGAFKSLHLFELPRNAERLERNLGDHKAFGKVTIYRGDSNANTIELLSAGGIDRQRPCFAMLDPNSTQLRWSTVEALSKYKVSTADQSQCKVELWILFNLHQAIQRLWERNSPMPTHARVLDKVMGDRTAWIDLWNAGASPTRLLFRYVERLAELGYEHVVPQTIVDPKTGRPQYYMIHATDHNAALAFMRWAKKKASDSLYHPEQLPGMSPH